MASMTSRAKRFLQRDDDTEEVVRERLAVYNEQTAPLIEFYHGQEVSGLRYICVDGKGQVEDIQNAIATGLG